MDNYVLMQAHWNVGVATLKRGGGGGGGDHQKRSQEASVPGHSDEPVVVLDLVYISRITWYYTLRVEKSHYCRWKHGKLSSGSEKVSKWRHNSWTKHFQWKPHDKNLKNTIKNPMTPSFPRINEVGSIFRGKRQTHRQSDYRNPSAHARRRLMTLLYCHIIIAHVIT
jgi:hypothetical protein